MLCAPNLAQHVAHHIKMGPQPQATCRGSALAWASTKPTARTHATLAGNHFMPKTALSHWRSPFKLLSMHMVSVPPEEMRSTEEKKASGSGN